jgi:ABC-type antimicrobial peptide transport system permease subunit
MASYLAFMEIWRNRSRFFLFSLVIALITTLVLFIAALAQGLSNANIEYLSKLDAQLIVFQKNVDLSASASQINRSTLNNIQRVDGVLDIGSIGASSGKIVNIPGKDPLDVSLLGVESMKPGSPKVISGSPITLSRGNEAVIDQGLSTELGLGLGDSFTIRTIQGTDEKFYSFRVTGITESQEYLYSSSIFLPYMTWDQIRPQPSTRDSNRDTVSNFVAVKLKPGTDPLVVAKDIQSQVVNVEVVDKKTAYEALPGYKVQQSTLNTQQGFTLLIGVLVIGGFFQIQMLQKVPLIGVLKAIGTSNSTVAWAVVTQIVLITTFGVIMGSLVTLGLAAAMPAGVPIIFNGRSILLAVAALLLIGPLGGLVSVKLAVNVEPLTALGLTS